MNRILNFCEFKKYLSELLVIALPILGGNLGQMFIGLGDVYVAGHYNTATLAVISVATAIFMTFIAVGLGLTSAVTPVLSNYRGQGRPVKKLLGVTILYSLALSLFFFCIIRLLIPFIDKLGLNPEIAGGTVEYLEISAFSVFFIFIYAVLKEFLQSFEIVIFPNLMMMAAVFLNVGLNFLFVYGLGMIPEMGVKGLALASLLVRIVLGVSLLLYSWRFFKGGTCRGIYKYILELLKVGMPIGGAMFIEFFGFNIVAIIVGRFEPLYAACHNIIITIVSTCYMLPFSISSALSVKTGYANGSKNAADIKKYTLSALYFIILYSGIAAAIYIIFKENLMRMFSNDLKVIKTGASIMIIAACFTTFDAVQSVCMGVLKGMKQTIKMLGTVFMSYMLVSIPTGLALAYKFNTVLVGFWLGLALGIFSSALISGVLLLRQYFKLKREINARVII